MTMMNKCVLSAILFFGIIQLSIAQDPVSEMGVENKEDSVDQSIVEPVTDAFHAFDVLHYRLDLLFPFENRSLSGRINATCLSEKDSLHDVVFHMVELTADSVFVNDQSADFDQQSGEIHISFVQSISREDSFNVSIYYHGAPRKGGFYFYSMCAYTYGEPVETRYWFPCKDVPWDKATVELHVTVPVGVEVASIGLLEGREIDQDGLWETFHWRTDYPVASYLVCVTMSSEYARWSDWYITPEGDSIELSYYVFTRDSAIAKEDFIHMVDAIAFFSDRFGAYPFEKYGMAEVEPFVMGGMEHQTMSTINSRWIRGTRLYEKGFVHELAHMWWGDAVTLNDWPAIWLNEGFATYSEALFAEFQYGQDSFQDKMATSKKLYLDQIRRLDFPLYDPPANQLFNSGIVYNKGSWILHMLRYVVGEDYFWPILNDYFETYCYGNASIPDFQAVCETVSEMDLDWFFNQWIYQKGYIRAEYGWASRLLESGQYAFVLSVSQIQRECPVFCMPLDVLIEGEGHVQDTTVWMDQSSHYFMFTLDFEPSNVVLDPDRWVLMDTDYVQDSFYRSSEIPEKFALFQNFPNPFNEMTVIYYDLPNSRQSWEIDLTVYDLRGRQVRLLLEEEEGFGRYWTVWDGTDDQGNIVPTGIYFVELSTEGYSERMKAVVVR